MAGALEGLRVMEWAYNLMGPSIGAALADIGAEVIKIEDISGGDPGRRLCLGGETKPALGGHSYFFEGFNRGKKSIALDLEQKTSKQIVYRLVAKSDVFLTTFPYQVVQRLGLDYDALRRHNPRLIYAYASGFGLHGEEANNPGADLAGQARSGIMFAAVDPQHGEPFAKSGMGEQSSSIMALTGIMAALLAREHTGVGQMIDSSVLGSTMWVSASNLHNALFANETGAPYDRRKPRSPVSNSYKAKDGKWLVILIPQETWWQPLCKALGRPELAEDSRFANQELRATNAAELVAILDGVFAQKSRVEWLKILKEADVPAAAANTSKETINDPQAIANEYVVDYDHPVLGKVKLLGSPIRFAETPANVCRRAPNYGEHTEEVLLNLAQCSRKDIEALRQQGAIKI